MQFSVARRPVNVLDPDLVNSSEPWPHRRLPVQLTPQAEGVDLPAWLNLHRADVELLLVERGGVLFRGFDVRTPADFMRVVSSFSTELIEYTERSTPRSEVGSFVYTSTEYPPDQVIPLHNENSYQRTWPRHLWFFCEEPADSGGETPIADSAAVFRQIDPVVRERFVERKVTYIRNYTPGLGLTWQNTFRTTSKREVERYCDSAGIECVWDHERLTTRQTREATATHPETGEAVWFNQVHLFHPSSLPESVHRALAATMSEGEFPRHACYGDGGPVDAESLDHIREVYHREQEPVRWQRGDVLLLDNMLVAHGRLSFRGQRRILVAMANPSSAA